MHSQIIDPDFHSIEKAIDFGSVPTFFVCDGASGEKARAIIECDSFEATPLIGDEIASPLGSYGPWLIAINQTAQLRQIVELFLSEPAGWIFQSRRSLADSRRFLKKLTFVELPSGDKVLFRYFDPRVFGAVLGFSNLTTEQKAVLFNGVFMYLIRNIDSKVLRIVLE